MFEDIRPYHDNEVAPVIRRIIKEKELQSSIASFALPKLYRFWPGLARGLVRLLLALRARKMKDVKSLQQQVAKYLESMMQRSSDGFSFDGIDQLDMNKPTLFVSNHRDIALDPALVNLALFEAGVTSVEIAIGDNLLTKDWLSDLMRLNKSFIVKRGEKKKREMLAASKQLSAYIHHALNEKQQHIWIAQREGRAKDGIDKTNPAVISMLLLNKPKGMAIADYLPQLNIVPVSISYELDPCDRHKAKELAAIEAKGEYQKDEHEDIRSISRGILGHKGRVHIHFGQPVVGEFEDSKAIAAEIDRQIITNYRLFETNLAADKLIQDIKAETHDAQRMISRLQGLDQQEQNWLLAMYANPVKAKQAAE